MSVLRPPSKITIEMQDRAFYEELSRRANQDGHVEELLGKRWHFVEGKWKGFDRAGVITLSEEVSDG